MTSGRPYNDKLSPQQALEELKKWAGIQFDPALIKLFCELHGT
jgi:HD-GYP domain-containing protein (c-di-GMP phosphodiesterase class II)